MDEMNIPYGTPYKDMSEMYIPYGRPEKKDTMENCPNSMGKMALAMAYVPDQMWETPYEVTEGLRRGTLFPSLDKPFMGGGNKP
jgi:hypothetical protein